MKKEEIQHRQDTDPAMRVVVRPMGRVLLERIMSKEKGGQDSAKRILRPEF